MDEKNVFVVYETIYKEITSLAQAKKEVAFLKKAFDMGLYNKLAYEGQKSGFMIYVNKKTVKKHINKILDDAKNGFLPTKYSIGLNARLCDGVEMDTKIYEKR